MLACAPNLSLDSDGDGYTLAYDCDDTDETVSPGALEVCDGIDRDCNGAIDDADHDQDGHIQVGCNYEGPDPRPVDDCDDTDPLVHGGVSVDWQDGVDNDCDGLVDNRTPIFDDDGDCYCEEGPCVARADCPAGVVGGDCDDANSTVHPFALDEPDGNRVDANCDGIDGDAQNSVFVDPVNGEDAHRGLTADQPLASLSVAIRNAQQEERAWILIAEGELAIASVMVAGIHLAGAYRPEDGWERGSAPTTLVVEGQGLRAEGWDQRTVWQELVITTERSLFDGASSIPLWAHDTTQLELHRCVLRARRGVPGASGMDGERGAHGSWGTGGGVGCDLCSATCIKPRAGQGPGNGGDGGPAASGPGGVGSPGKPGLLPIAPGGAGYAYHHGDDGSWGISGEDGLSGPPGEAGEFNTMSLTYVPRWGTDGAAGRNGGGGGGGAGGGGAGTHDCPHVGGAGGGGGEGGSGGLGGGAGQGGGASIGLVATGSSVITLVDTHVLAARGGPGGLGGLGGVGGHGGFGGAGGRGGGGFGGGDGGKGGFGGAGGHGGHGAGGAFLRRVLRAQGLGDPRGRDLQRGRRGAWRTRGRRRSGPRRTICRHPLQSLARLPNGGVTQPRRSSPRRAHRRAR